MLGLLPSCFPGRSHRPEDRRLSCTRLQTRISSEVVIGTCLSSVLLTRSSRFSASTSSLCLCWSCTATGDTLHIRRVFHTLLLLTFPFYLLRLTACSNCAEACSMRTPSRHGAYAWHLLVGIPCIDDLLSSASFALRTFASRSSLNASARVCRVVDRQWPLLLR